MDWLARLTQYKTAQALVVGGPKSSDHGNLQQLPWLLVVSLRNLYCVAASAIIMAAQGLTACPLQRGPTQNV